MPSPRVLLVDDDEVVRLSLSTVLASHGFEVTSAATVTEALKMITLGAYDVLLSDLHMPGAGDGLTVVSAMRHANPQAVTLLLSAYPEMGAAAQAILLQTDEILVKPMMVPELIAVIKQRLAEGATPARVVESVATILERTANITIQEWFERVELEPKLMAIPMSFSMRCGHLPQLFQDLVMRLRSFKALGSKEVLSIAAAVHGKARRDQGYTAAMMVEESRMLQVSIFQTLQNNLGSIDFSVLLVAVMTIADEVDAQLAQAMECYTEEVLQDGLPLTA